MSLPSRWWTCGQNSLAQVLPVARVRERAEVVDQGVYPDVGDLLLVPGDRHAPRLAGAADAEVLETALDEAARLVVAEARQDEIGALVVELQQLVLVGREAEEPVRLLDPLRRDPVVRAQPVDELGLRLELLALDAIEPRVDVLVDVAVVVDALQELLHESLVPLVGRADEEVVLGVDALGQLSPVLLDDLVDVRLRVEPLLLGDAVHLRGVLVGAGEEEGLLAALLVVPDEHVRGDRRVRVPDVRARVDVVDRRCQVVAHRSQ